MLFGDTDVMVNGAWLMRDHVLLTINEAELLVAAHEYARKIDIFLIAREKSLLSKLLALGEDTEEEDDEDKGKLNLPWLKKKG